MAPSKQTEIWEAKEAAEIGRRLIAEHHPHLAEANILYLFTSKTRKKHGRVVLGTAQKLTALQRYLSAHAELNEDDKVEADFIILISSREWQWLKENQSIALVDHELCHCYYTGDLEGEWEYALRGHDVEEFTEVVMRHGLWKSDVADMAQAVKQLALPMERVFSRSGRP